MFLLQIIVRIQNRMNSSHILDHPSNYWMCRLCVDYMEAAGNVLVEFEGATSTAAVQAKFTV